MLGTPWTTTRPPSPESESSDSVAATYESSDFFNWECTHTFNDPTTSYHHHTTIPYNPTPSPPSSPDLGFVNNVAATSEVSETSQSKAKPMEFISAAQYNHRFFPPSNIIFSTGSPNGHSLYDLTVTIPYTPNPFALSSSESGSPGSVKDVAATNEFYFSPQSTPTFSPIYSIVPGVPSTSEQMTMFNIIEDSITLSESLAVTSWYYQEDSLIKNGLAVVKGLGYTIPSPNWTIPQTDKQMLDISSNNFRGSNELTNMTDNFKDAKDALRRTWTENGKRFMEWWRNHMSKTQREALVLRAFFKTGDDLTFAEFRQFVIDLRVANFVKDDGEGLVGIVDCFVNNNDAYALANFVTPTQGVVFDRWSQSTPKESSVELNCLKWNCTVSRSIFAVQVCRAIMTLFGEVLEVGCENSPLSPSQMIIPSDQVDTVSAVEEDAPKKKSKKNKKRGANAREKHDARKKEKRAIIFQTKSAIDATVAPAPLYNGSSYSMTGNQLCEQECEPFHVPNDLDGGEQIKLYNLAAPDMYTIVSVPVLTFDRFISYDSGAETEEDGKISDFSQDENEECIQIQPWVEFPIEDDQVVYHQGNDEANLIIDKDDITDDSGKSDVGFDTTPDKDEEMEKEEVQKEAVVKKHEEDEVKSLKQVGDEVAEETAMTRKMKDYEDRILTLEALVGQQSEELREEVKRRIAAEEAKGKEMEMYELRVGEMKQLFAEEVKEMKEAEESAEEDIKDAREAQRGAELKAQAATEKESEAAAKIQSLTGQLQNLREQQEAGTRDCEAERMGLEKTILGLTKGAAAAQEKLDTDTKTFKVSYQIVRGLKDTLKLVMRRPHSGVLEMPLQTAKLINSSIKELKQLLQLHEAIEWEQALIRKGRSDALDALDALANLQTFVTNLVEEDSGFINEIAANMEDRKQNLLVGREEGGIPEGGDFEEGVRRLFRRSFPGLEVGGS